MPNASRRVSILQARCSFLLESEAREDCASGRAVGAKTSAERRISAWANGYYCLAPDWRSPHAKKLALRLAYSLSREKKQSEEELAMDICLKKNDIFENSPIESHEFFLKLSSFSRQLRS